LRTGRLAVAIADPRGAVRHAGDGPAVAHPDRLAERATVPERRGGSLGAGR
jgi:hypothetical protein